MFSRSAKIDFSLEIRPESTLKIIYEEISTLIDNNTSNNFRAHFLNLHFNTKTLMIILTVGIRVCGSLCSESEQKNAYYYTIWQIRLVQ